MVLIKLNEIYCEAIESKEEMEKLVEESYRNNERLEILVKPK
jgi:hypothetical protein